MELAKTIYNECEHACNANNFARSGISNSSLLIKKRGTTKTKQCLCNGNALAIVAEDTFAKYNCIINGCQNIC